MLDLEPIKGMLKDVKPGPWDDQVTADGGLVVYLDSAPPKDQPYQNVDFLFFGDMEDTEWQDHATAAFVAHSREFVPQMIEEIESLRSLLIGFIWGCENSGHRPAEVWSDARRILGNQDPLRFISPMIEDG